MPTEGREISNVPVGTVIDDPGAIVKVIAALAEVGFPNITLVPVPETIQEEEKVIEFVF